MTSAIELSCDNFRCEIAPGLGGSIAGLWLDDIPVLRSTPARALTTARQSGSYPLVPFSNRMAHATLKWDGTSHPLVQTGGDEPHSIHGVGWQRPWTVLEADAHFALLSYEHKPDDAWPFAFDTSQAFRLSASELELSLSITNQSAVAAPVGLGWHPCFVKRARSRISFEATGRWEMSADKLPTHRVEAHGLDADCAVLDVDHCFDGWPGVVHLRDEQLYTRVSSNLNRLVVFTRSSRDVVTIEPVSHVTNAINLMTMTSASANELGVRVLQPGESMSAEMSIHVERVK
ncbi:MAG: aldose 1-epimerase [Rhodoferax sp.]|uniref:aldose 1-epimerase n=1 Tax=Rhodoferax sp. TaxID=50421 RepID=UPI00271D5417|nr:aldose 1-epimerase [Rhodoferax sp.]MDO8449529.1 aldose 1-epimerase [Rhodoferax sp.]